MTKYPTERLKIIELLLSIQCMTGSATVSRRSDNGNSFHVAMGRTEGDCLADVHDARARGGFGVLDRLASRGRRPSSKLSSALADFEYRSTFQLNIVTAGPRLLAIKPCEVTGVGHHQHIAVRGGLDHDSLGWVCPDRELKDE